LAGLDDAEAAALEWAFADQPACDLAQIVHTGPADVPAARALAGIEMSSLADGTSPRAAGKTFDANGLHPYRFGSTSGGGDPSNG
jgi:hypothetical protein